MIKMKKMIKFFAFAVVVAAFTLNASGQASANGTATAVIVTPISLTNQRDLTFGNIAAGPGGTVTITNADPGVVSSTGVSLVGGIARTSGQFTVGGTTGLAYTVTLPASTTISNGAVTMTVNAFTHNASGTLPAASEIFFVGGTLNIGAAQATGSYTGTYSVQVSYN